MHGVYHQFFQDHLSLKGGGISWGHWASRDFVRWTSLPVAIWPDQWYDGNAIFTGSATLDESGKECIQRTLTVEESKKVVEEVEAETAAAGDA